MSLSVAPDGVDLAVVGAALSVSAEMVRLVAVTGVAAVLSMNAFESVIITITAMPAPEAADAESAVDVTFVLTSAISDTPPLEAVMELVPESCDLALASTKAATTDESFCSARVQLPSRPVSSLGWVVLPAMRLGCCVLLAVGVGDDVALRVRTDVVRDEVALVGASRGLGRRTNVDLARQCDVPRRGELGVSVDVHRRVILEIERRMAQARVAAGLVDVLAYDHHRRQRSRRRPQ